VVYGTQLIAFGWLRGDTSHLIEPTEDILGRVPSLPAWRAALALVQAFGGRGDDARELLRDVATDLDALSFSSTWSGALIGLAEAARVLDDRESAAAVYERLAPYGDRLSVISLSLTTMGPISHVLGVLARLQGDLARAEGHLLDALATCERIGSPPYDARARVQLAHVLLERGGEENSARAGELLARGLDTARELGMAEVMLDALQLKSNLAAATGTN
jgi:ATP/maltotriose-dependent transcriptional regulator MalT